MITQRQVSMVICDVCGKKESYNRCLNCGKDICSKCKEDHMVTLPYSLYCGGSYEGDYCTECYNKLLRGKHDKLFALYLKMQELRRTYDSMHKLMREEGDALEKEITILRSKNK